ncbi:MAG: GNAT family N-acetyltransferase [Anaerolineales bacterium]|nr:GNAT family N-acetyltransferase [Anaerolineales bacterium]
MRPSPPPMEFILISDFSSIDAAEWNGLLAEAVTDAPFLRHEYLRTWWETRGGGEWPESAKLAIVAAHRDGHLAGIAPLFSTPNREGDPSLLLLGSIEISDYLDLIAAPADLADFVAGLLDFLPGLPYQWNLLDLHVVPESSPTLAALQDEAARRGWACDLQPEYHAPSIPLPGDFETYLAGIDKKQRHEIRRKMRRAEESGRAVHWYIVSDAGTLEAEIEAFLDLMAHDPEKATFLTASMRTQMRLACQAAFEGGWLQLAFMEVDGQKAAGYLNFDYADRIWVYNSGLDRAFMDLSPGWVLLGYLLQWANDEKRAEFDFMRGDEEYKYRFGAVDRIVVRARVSR